MGIGLANKGRLNVGADADITIFDLDKVKDGATFESPATPPVGIDYVLLGGEFALKDGNIVNANRGKAIRK